MDQPRHVRFKVDSRGRNPLNTTKYLGAMFPALWETFEGARAISHQPWKLMCSIRMAGASARVRASQLPSPVTSKTEIRFFKVQGTGRLRKMRQNFCPAQNLCAASF